MGFFGDLKQDLSQAVEELLPEDRKAQDPAFADLQDPGPETGEELLREMEGLPEAVPEEVPAQAPAEAEETDLNALLEEALGKLPDGEDAPLVQEAPLEQVQTPEQEAPAGTGFDIGSTPLSADEPAFPMEEQAQEVAAHVDATWEDVQPMMSEMLSPEELPAAGPEMMEAATGAESYEMPVQSDPATPIAEPMEDPEQSLEAAMAMGDAIDAAFADLEAFGEAGAAEEPEAAETAQEAAISAADLTDTQIPYSAENNYKGAEKIMDSSDERNYSEESSVITGGVLLDGNLTTEGSLDLLGTVNGNLSVGGKLNVTGSITGNSKAREIFAENAKICGDLTSDSAIKIGEGTVIIGNITALSAAIAGAVKGDIDVHGPVILDSTAIVMGNIKSKSVQINNGATLEGNCSQCYADVSPTSFFDEYKPAQKKADKSDKSDKEKSSK